MTYLTSDRQAPLPVFLSTQYRELMEKLEADFSQYGVKVQAPVQFRRWGAIAEQVEKSRYSSELAMHSALEVLASIEAQVKMLINYPED